MVAASGNSPPPSLLGVPIYIFKPLKFPRVLAWKPTELYVKLRVLRVLAPTWRGEEFHLLKNRFPKHYILANPGPLAVTKMLARHGLDCWSSVRNVVCCHVLASIGPIHISHQ